jgi:subtilase family serine protease
MRVSTLALALGAALASVAAPSAAVWAAQPLERSGDTWHVAVCPPAKGRLHARCHAHVVTDWNGKPIMRPLNATGPAGPKPAGYGPDDLQSAYNVATASARKGEGVTIAIVDAYGYPNAESDLAVYRSQFGLPACTTANGCFTKVDQDGSTHYPTANLSWAQEQALDLDMVSAICPHCHILLVEAKTDDIGNLAAAVNMAAALRAHAISNSYGFAETATGPYESAYDHPGIAVTASTGDDGYGAQFPATSPHVTAVGGTTLTRADNARGWSETAWPGGGSGCSAVYPKPAWQTDPLCPTRMEADTAAVADPNTGVAVYGPASAKLVGWMVFGGTSVSAPLTAGLYGINGSVVTYGSDPYSHAQALHDITSGSNGSCNGTYFCTAGPGYNGPTGLGTPNGIWAF